MKIVQNEDGSAEFQFNEEELKVINQNKKFIMTAGFFKNFTNILMRLIAESQDRFPEKIKNKESKFIEGTDKVK